MWEQLKIFTEQLRHDRRETWDVMLPPEFLNLHEKEIHACYPIALKGTAYIVEDLLMLSFHIATKILMPCSVCNKEIEVPLENKNILISIPLDELPSSVFNCSDLIREEIVLLLPQFVECKKGACPHRAELKPFLKTEHNKNFPFADLH